MALTLHSPIEPMLAEAHDEIPVGPGWRYEPKWDGFRALVFREGDRVHLCSREGKALERYFPELVTSLKGALRGDCVIDGEIILPTPRGLSFDDLQARVHPAASRVEKLSRETPTAFVAFDALEVDGAEVMSLAFSERRVRLEGVVQQTPQVFVTLQTTDAQVAGAWFHEFEGAGCDGVIARREEGLYAPGKRVMQKIKHGRTAECVVGGFRVGKTPETVGALLLGLHDDSGVLHFVGHTSSFTAKQKKELYQQFNAIRGDSFGQGRTPGGVSRWSAGKDLEWVAVTPSRVCEVRYDYLQGPRFRHGTTFLRWREDRSPQSCLYRQLEPPRPFSLEKLMPTRLGQP